LISRADKQFKHSFRRPPYLFKELTLLKLPLWLDKKSEGLRLRSLFFIGNYAFLSDAMPLIGRQWLSLYLAKGYRK